METTESKSSPLIKNQIVETSNETSTRDKMVVNEIDYEVRKLRENEIPQVLELCKSEGRQMGLTHELISWFRFDPDGFYVAVHPDSGEILGSCVGIKLSKFHGNIGMFVVRTDLRGKGIGKNLWNHVMSHLNSCSNQRLSGVSSTGLRTSVSASSGLFLRKPNIGLSALNSLLTVYRDKAGFTFVSDWAVLLYQIHIKKLQFISFGHHHPSPLSSCNSINQQPQQPPQQPSTAQLLHQPSLTRRGSIRNGLKIIPFSAKILHSLLAFDAKIHSYDRRKIVRFLLTEPEVMVRVGVRDQKIVGYGVIKPSLQGDYMIAPLYAVDPVVAHAILCDLIRSLKLVLYLNDERRGGETQEDQEGCSSDQNGNERSDRDELESQGNTESEGSRIVLKIPSCNYDGIQMIESIGFDRNHDYLSWRCYTESLFDIQSDKIFAFHSTVFCSE